MGQVPLIYVITILVGQQESLVWVRLKKKKKIGQWNTFIK